MQDMEYLVLYAAERSLQEQHRPRVAWAERGREPREGIARSSRLIAQRIRASRRHNR